MLQLERTVCKDLMKMEEECSDGEIQLSKSVQMSDCLVPQGRVLKLERMVCKDIMKMKEEDVKGGKEGKVT